METLQLNKSRKEKDLKFFKKYFQIKGTKLKSNYITISSKGDINRTEAYILSYADIQTIKAYYFEKRDSFLFLKPISREDLKKKGGKNEIKAWLPKGERFNNFV